nr:FUSC family protein [Corynebacterium aquatimens]
MRRILPALQIGLAAGLAYWIAHEWVGHHQPFFAPVSVVLIVGFSGGERINRAFDISLGCVFGVLLGDLFFAPLGAGGWQIALAVTVSLLFASFFTKSELVAAQCAIGSVLIATILPPGSAVTGIDRTIDAFIGSLVGLVVLGLLPTAPLTAARLEIASVLKVLSAVLSDVSSSLRNAQTTAPATSPTATPTRSAPRDTTAAALETIRGTQTGIDAISSATKYGREQARLSPFFWRTRGEVTSLSQVAVPTDNAIRNTRVLVRRALVLAEDRDPVSDTQLEILNELADITLDIAAVYDSPFRRLPRYSRDRSAALGFTKTPSPFKQARAEKIPELEQRLRVLAAKTGLDVLDVPGQDRPALSAAVILGQSRSLIVDLLQICGVPREKAIATLAPTSDHPGFAPDLTTDLTTDTRN